ncbi:MAG: protein-L-isoaspartate(D-aspartate) O-methyltransferase, partial [Candidatus Bathyarchaeia archaeon]
MASKTDYEAKRDRIVRVLVSRRVIRSQSVIKAMMTVPREEFVRKGQKEYAYIDTPLQIGYGQTISAIHMVGMMAEALELDIGQTVLEVGAGSGYHAAVVAEIVSPGGVDSAGHVYTVEIVPELAEFARRNLKRTGYADRVTVLCGDGSKGYSDKAPYDRVLVTAAAPEVPRPLVEQLKVGGVLVIPVGGIYFFQNLLKVQKVSEEKTVTKNLGGVA